MVLVSLTFYAEDEKRVSVFLVIHTMKDPFEIV